MDQDWKVRSGLPLEDACFTAADGMKLFRWNGENCLISAVVVVSAQRRQRRKIEVIAKNNAHTIVLRYWCAERQLFKLDRDSFYLSTGETVDVVDRNESI
jgi:hypothetical protein